MRTDSTLALVFLASARIDELDGTFTTHRGSVREAVSVAASHPNLFHVYILDVGAGVTPGVVASLRNTSPNSAILVIRSALEQSPATDEFYEAGGDFCHVYETLDGSAEIQRITRTLLRVVMSRHEESWRRRLEQLRDRVVDGAEWKEIGGLVLSWFQADGFARGRLYHIVPSTDAFECLLSSNTGNQTDVTPAGRYARDELQPILDRIRDERLTQWNWPRLREAFEDSGRDVPRAMRTFYRGDESREWIYVTVTHAREVIANIALDRIGSPVSTITETDRRCLEMVAKRVPHILSRVLEADLSLRTLEDIDGLDIVHEDEQFNAVLQRAKRIARCAEPVLIHGETGVGKEVLARAIHEASPRSHRKFVPTNCAELSKDLTNAAFGSVRGAFTGALDKMGIFEEADGGTLFLDEIGDLSLEVQAMILRVTDTGEFRRLGDTNPRHTSLRIVCATNKNLEVEVAAGRFRRDLYFRVAAFTIEVPPLRSRPKDILAWANRVLDAQSKHLRTRVSLSPSVERFLLTYSWPGNFRQLKSLLRTALTLAGSETVIRPEHIPQLPAEEEVTKVDDAEEVLEKLLSGGENFWDAILVPYKERTILRTTVRQVVELGLDRSGGSYKVCARLFGLEAASDYKKFMDFLRIHDLRPIPHHPRHPERRNRPSAGRRVGSQTIQ